MVIAAAFLLLWLGSSLFALRYGGCPERWIALLLFVAFPASILVRKLNWAFGHIDLGLVLIDGSLLCGLVAVALRADRFWPMPIASMQILAMVGHALKLIEPDTLPLIYWLTNVVWAYPMQTLLALGTERHRARERRSGLEPCWSKSSAATAAVSQKV